MAIRRNAGIDFRLFSTDAHRMETSSLRTTHHVRRDPALAACHRRAVMATSRDRSPAAGGLLVVCDPIKRIMTGLYRDRSNRQLYAYLV